MHNQFTNYHVYCTCIIQYCCVILRELAISTLLSYMGVLMQLLVIKFKILHFFEISGFKIFKILKLSYL
jgi:hypothetical protein